MTCANCGRPLVTVTIGGVTVWTHDRDDRVVLSLTTPHGPRMCEPFGEVIAQPKTRKAIT